MVDLNASDLKTLVEQHKLIEKLEHHIAEGNLKHYERPNPYFHVTHDRQPLGLKVLMMRYLQTFMLPEVERLVERASRMVQDPQLVTYYSFSQDVLCQYFCLCMQHINGVTLREMMYDKGSGMPEYEVRERVRQVCDALAVLHSAGIVHGKLDASKVIMSDIGEQVIIDYVVPPHLYSPHCACAPVHCTAPEIVHLSAYGRPADIWSIGTLVLELVTNSIQWTVFSDLEAFVRSKQPILPAHLVHHGSLSKAGIDFVMGCLRRAPEDRFKLVELRHHPFLKGESPVWNLVGTNVSQATRSNDANGHQTHDDDPAVASIPGGVSPLRPSSAGYSRKVLRPAKEDDINEDIGSADHPMPPVPKSRTFKTEPSTPGSLNSSSRASSLVFDDHKNGGSPRRLNSSLQLPRTNTSR